MTSVQSSTATMQIVSPNTAASKNMADYETFLQILVTQLKNQDPTEPMDSAQYVSQLASFSNVEQNIQINTKLEKLLDVTRMSQIDSIIGKNIRSADGTVSGVAIEVRIGSDNLIAILDNGLEVPILAGTVVSL